MRRKLAVILLGAVLLTGCGMSKEEKEFVDVVESDIVMEQNAWLDEGYKLEHAQKSMDSLEKYRRINFEDEKFDEAAKNYISGVELSKEVLETDVEGITDTLEMFAWSKMDNQSEELKYRAVKTLMKDYGLKLENQDEQEYLEDWITSMDKEQLAFEKLKDGIANAKIKKDGRKVAAEIENTSGSDASSATFKISLKDASGYIVYEDTEMVLDWNIGEIHELWLFPNVDFETVEITDVNANWNI